MKFDKFINEAYTESSTKNKHIVIVRKVLELNKLHGAEDW